MASTSTLRRGATSAALTTRQPDQQVDLGNLGSQHLDRGRSIAAADQHLCGDDFRLPQNPDRPGNLPGGDELIDQRQRRREAGLGRRLLHGHGVRVEVALVSSSAISMLTVYVPPAV